MRKYTLNEHSLNPNPEYWFGLAKRSYAERFPGKKARNPNASFAYCFIYLVVQSDKTLKVELKFPEDLSLEMRFVHKAPYGAVPGQDIRNVDIREVTNIVVPPYDDRYYFDFVCFVQDITTDGYWIGHLWTGKVCRDRRYYLSRTRRLEYQEVGSSLAESYTRTLILGHVNLRNKKIRSSPGLERLINHGWIPTFSLLPQPYAEMINIVEQSNDMSKVESFAVKVFNSDILDDVISRWKKASLAARRVDVLEAAIEAHKESNYHASVYILLPQIEGMITEHIIRRKQLPKKRLGDRFVQFGRTITSEAFNTQLTRYLVEILVKHLKGKFYKTWYPGRNNNRAKPSLAPQRNILMHGEVHPKYFTPVSSIKLICAVDAIILLSLNKRELPGQM